MLKSDFLVVKTYVVRDSGNLHGANCTHGHNCAQDHADKLDLTRVRQLFSVK